MIIQTMTEWSGVPEGTKGDCMRDEDLFKVVWHLKGNREKKRPLTDWFNQVEFDKYLIIISV